MFDHIWYFTQIASENGEEEETMKVTTKGMGIFNIKVKTVHILRLYY